jgi:hypothetical protein
MVKHHGSIEKNIVEIEVVLSEYSCVLCMHVCGVVLRIGG